MKVRLMDRGRDFDMQGALPSNEGALTRDLELKTLFNAMSDGDEFLHQVAKQALLSGLKDDPETIRYRQAILRDCLRNDDVVREAYEIVVETVGGRRGSWLSMFSRYPSGILYEARELLGKLTETLGRLKRVADEHSSKFDSEGFRAFFSLLKEELADEYLARIRGDLKDLKFRDGVLLSAELGKGNAGTNYVLRKSTEKRRSWIRRIFSQGPPAYSFRLHPRDEAGAQALSNLQNRGINLVANALAQSAEHILGFLMVLRTELAFYLGCMNLHRRLEGKGVPLCFPTVASDADHELSCTGLREACLALITPATVGNDLDADGKQILIITGANQGGKSTFLRSVGMAQLMMQCGMFVAAERFRADVCRGIFTHFKREEDSTMKRGKLDEDLARMSGIVDALTPGSMLLLNESFAATNEREGSEIARQIVRALLETRIRVLFVTHLFEFAHRLGEENVERTLFLRAERQPEGRRTFKVLPGNPLETSFSADLYAAIFNASPESAIAERTLNVGTQPTQPKTNQPGP